MIWFSFFFFFRSLPHGRGCSPKWRDMDVLRESMRQLPVSWGRCDLLETALPLHVFFFYFFLLVISIFRRLGIDSQVQPSPESNRRSSSEFRIVLSAVPFQQIAAMPPPGKVKCHFRFRPAMDLPMSELRMSGKQSSHILFFFLFSGITNTQSSFRLLARRDRLLVDGMPACLL